MTSAEYMRERRSCLREQGLTDNTRRYKSYHKRVAKRMKAFNNPRYFVGCDGEGCGTDEKGRQLYMLFRMGDRELFTGRALRTIELLDFICAHSATDLLVGFAFGYDVTMVLRDLSSQQQFRLFQPIVFEKGHSRYTWFKNFDIEYLPKQYFRVKRVKIVRGEDGTEKRIPIEGSQRTIYEVFGFFQKSFLKVLYEFEIGTIAEQKLIAESKDARSSFETITEEIRSYCALECRFLAELMEKLRTYCYDAGIVPRTWNGAGKLAAALHAKHNTPKAKDAFLNVPQEVWNLANMAYYGGRFEITRAGNIEEKVYEYDLRSAYPAAMRKLPCLLHGRWTRTDHGLSPSSNDLYIATCNFSIRSTSPRNLGSLPIRSEKGHLYWPARGGGVYWSDEIRSAIESGVQVRLKDVWVYERNCNCKLFEWVEELYDYRQSIGAQGPGFPIKLAINSLYGKLAQRKGNGVYNNMIWAGLITARTRAVLNDAIRQNPASVVMLATDALYSLSPLDLDIGTKLGQWEASELDGLFIVQPGLYWCPAKRERFYAERHVKGSKDDFKRKSRGLPGKFFETAGMTEAFEHAWQSYRADYNSGTSQGFPRIDVPVDSFVGLKLALARNKPDLAGTWIRDCRSISFDYTNKRFLHEWNGEHIVTSIKPGHSKLVSLPHRDFLAAGGHEPWENARAMLDDQPDYVDLGPPFED